MYWPSCKFALKLEGEQGENKMGTKISLYTVYLHQTGLLIFSSPEPKAQVSYCHSALSVVRPSVHRRPSVRHKLSHFQLLLQNRLMDFDETW